VDFFVATCFFIFQGHQPSHSPVHHAGTVVFWREQTHAQTSEASAGETERILRIQWVV